MEPKKKIKKFSEFTQSNHPRSIFNHEIYEPTQSFRRIMELPMSDVLGVFRVDAERPQVQMEQIELPLRRGEKLPRRMMGRMAPQPMRVRFRDSNNISETELQDFMWSWVNNGGRKNISIITLDPTAIVTERWDLINCFPSEVGYYTINNDEGQHYLEMTLHYDYFNLNS